MILCNDFGTSMFGLLHQIILTFTSNFLKPVKKLGAPEEMGEAKTQSKPHHNLRTQCTTNSSTIRGFLASKLMLELYQ